MQYRPVSAEERLNLMELQAQSFFFTYDRERYRKDMAGGDPKNSGRGCFDERGGLLAGMELIPFGCRFDGSTAGTGGVGGVACWPEHRNGGCVRYLMESALNEMRERGDVFSLLYPFSFPYYRKFGYEACWRAARVKAPLEPFAALRRPGRAERFVPGEGGSDPAPIVEIYNDFIERYNLAVDREGWRWRDLLEADPMKTRRHAYVWRGEDGSPGAYALFRAEPENEPDTMHILEAAWRSDEDLLGLLGFLSGFRSSLRTVLWTMPPDLDPCPIWPDLYGIKTEWAFEGMCRVVNAQKALRLMAKPSGKGSVKVAVADGTVPANAGTYKVDWEDGESSVRRVRGAGADLECSEAALAQLVTGYLPFRQLRMRKDVAVHAKEEELGRLFVQKATYTLDKF